MYIEPTINEALGICPLICNQTNQVETESAVRPVVAKLKAIFSRMSVWLSCVFTSRCNGSFEQWRQLEYRNEMATRMGERMNLRTLC